MRETYLSETLSLSVLLKAECREVHSATEHFRFCQNAHAAYTINLHLHIRVTVRIAKVGEMRSPSGVLGVAFHDDRVFVEGICERKRGLGLLPAVEVVGLFAAEPVRERAPDILPSALA